ncbi:MAG: hypothetical protein LKI92_05735 [Schleiferilactobacillus harbinensis]|jgi:hypothetical protein|nr:hypothetical protein [Schleiferilactobacillus harbinensis]MCI1911390.1 hypothetical protein [Schleiferilactobacillus harbinensis]
MTTKPKRWRIVLVMALSIIVSMIVYRVYQDEKAREAKRIDMIGTVDPETLVASKKPVTKLQIGVTYIAYSKKEWSDYVWNYFKLLTKSRILYVADSAHLPRSFYYQSARDGDSDSKWLSVLESKYAVVGKNYVSLTGGTSAQVTFDVKENVRTGSSGEYVIGPAAIYESFGTLEFKNGRYRTNTVELDGYPGELYKAKIQLPNSINAYLKQYKLTKIN